MMKFRELFGGIFCLTVGVLTLASCDNKDSVPDPLKATVDVFIQNSTTNAVTTYGVVISSSANYEIKSAKVTAPGTDGKVYTLVATSDKKQFVFTPAAADYIATVPVKGDYTFEIISVNDEKVTGKDVVGDETLSAISIKTATMTTQILTTTWDKITGADAYSVNLYSADKSVLLFSGATIAADKVEFPFGSTTAGWVTGKAPVANTSYIVELVGKKYETGVVSDKTNNVQFNTIATKTIKWE